MYINMLHHEKLSNMYVWAAIWSITICQLFVWDDYISHSPKVETISKYKWFNLPRIDLF